MTSDRLPDDLVLSDEQVREVIERAARQLPASDGVTLAELREIAAELDIAPAALERALDDVIGLPIAGHPIRTWLKRRLTRVGRLVDRFLPPKGRLVAGALFGGLAGWLNAFLMGLSINGHYPIAVGMVFVTIANLLSRRLDRRFLKYVTETVATWAAYAVLWATTYGGVTQMLVAWCLLWTMAAILLAALMIRAEPGGDDGVTMLETSVDEKRTELPPASDGPWLERTRRVRALWPVMVRRCGRRRAGRLLTPSACTSRLA